MLKVYVPDDDIAWARATVVHALGGSKFEVNVERPEEGSGMRPRVAGTIFVDASGPGFEGMDSLPLQVGEILEKSRVSNYIILYEVCI